MTDKKKLEAIEEAFNYYHDRTSLTRLEEKELTDFVYELKAAINYTHSCTELRDKEPTLVYNGRDRFGKEIWLNKDKT